MKTIFVILSLTGIFLFLHSMSPVMAGPEAGPPLLSQLPAAPPRPAVPPAPGTPRVPSRPPVPPQAPSPPPPGLEAPRVIPPPALLDNLLTAVETVRNVEKQLKPGRVWLTRLPGGETDIKAALLYKETAVGVLHFSSTDGRSLPLGVPPRRCENCVDLQQVKAALPDIVRGLRVIPAAEFVEPESAWSFPIAAGNALVARLKVWHDGIHIVPDRPADQEMRQYGR